MMSGAAVLPQERASASAGVRERWRMGAEARGLVLVMAVLLAFGLAVLYSASAIVAMQENRESWYYIVRQITGVLVGVVAFAVAAKLPAERWERWAWPIMWITIASLLLCLLLPPSIAPRINGSKRFLFGASFQPSEFGKLGVVLWTSMLIVKKGDRLRRLTKGVLPFFVVIGLLDILVALEPDLSVAMLYTMLLAVLLFVGGVRVAHFVALFALAIPLLWKEIEKVQYALLRLTSFLDPGSAPSQLNYQLKQSLIAVGSGGAFGVGFGQGRQQYGFLPFPYSDFIASNIGEEWGFIGLAAVTLAFAAYALLGFRIAR
jgi:cell division protein FtsW